MTDRELLEKAAKAAGVVWDVEASKPHPKSGAFWGLWLVIDHEPSEYDRRYWNPLTDDGDALRLAVKLQINVRFVWDGENDQYDPVIAGRGRCQAEEQIGITERHEFDEAAATRRAITRAAAAIGEGAT